MTVENPILGAAILFLVWFGPSLIVVWIAITAIDKIKEHLGRDTKKNELFVSCFDVHHNDRCWSVHL